MNRAVSDPPVFSCAATVATQRNTTKTCDIPVDLRRASKTTRSPDGLFGVASCLPVRSRSFACRMSEDLHEIDLAALLEGLSLGPADGAPFSTESDSDVAASSLLSVFSEVDEVALDISKAFAGTGTSKSGAKKRISDGEVVLACATFCASLEALQTSRALILSPSEISKLNRNTAASRVTLRLGRLVDSHIASASLSPALLALTTRVFTRTTSMFLYLERSLKYELLRQCRCVLFSHAVRSALPLPLCGAELRHPACAALGNHSDHIVFPFHQILLAPCGLVCPFQS